MFQSIKKSHLIWVTTTLCLAGFFIPFIFRTCSDTLISVLSESFTVVGTIATLATFVIAILLYDRFGLEGKFVAKRTDKVLELIDLLKGKVITVKGKGFEYFVRPSRSQLIDFNRMSFYKNDCKKAILMRMDDYNRGTNDLLALRRSYWLPSEIKEKMKFLAIAGLVKLEDFTDEKFIKLNFGFDSNEEWRSTLPEMTFENFNVNLHDLIKEIEDWLKKYSSISLDLKLEEPNQHQR